jgi:hypothetical protein
VTYRTALIQAAIWTGLIIFCAFVVNLSYIGIQSGLIPTSENNGTGGPPTKFQMQVAENGQTYFTSIEEGWHAVSEEFKDELLGTRHTPFMMFSDPDAAMVAVTGPLPGNAAYAHGGYVCWHQNYSKEWAFTANSKHVTWHRKDYGGRRYTTTAHKTLSGGYWVTTDLFKTSVALGYCN